MSDEMAEIITEFITEAEESLEHIDPLFVELEAKTYDREILNEIFRSMHTIKGAAGFLGFQNIVDVAHRSENILKKLRDGEMTVSTSLMDTILKSVDMIRLLLRHIKLNDGMEEDTSLLLRELDEALNVSQSSTAAETINTEALSSAATSAQDTADGFDINDIESIQANMHKETDKIEESVKSETVIQPLPSKSAVISAHEGSSGATAVKDVAQTLRVDVNRVDKVMDLTGEIVLVRNRLLNIANYLENKYSEDNHVENLLSTVSFLDLVTSDMQLAVMKMRMQPLKKVFGKFPRLVRDMAVSLDKDIELEISGEDTEVDRFVIEHIGDPMVHIIRNSIDHGIESMEERRRKGKSAKGRLSISASQQGNQIVIDVSDDGKGIDVEKVKRKAVEKGIVTDEDALRMTEENAINLIFMPGFSTADVATNLSGRGVGMDVVKTNILKLNGYVDVVTKKDAGSTFRISIPLTLAIVQALMVRIDKSQYAVPLAPIIETIKVDREDIGNVSGQKVLVVRGKVLPLFELTEILGFGDTGNSDYRYVLVIAIGERRFCIAVDDLLGQEEIVIKTIDGINTDESYVVGATITGEGKVVLILDLAGMSRNVMTALKA